MYSQANVRAGKWLWPPLRALPSVTVDTEKVLREADGPMKRAVPRPAMRDGWKGFRPGVRLKSRTVRGGEEAEEHKRECIEGLARITPQKELATTHFVKGGTLQNACFTRPRVVAGLGEKCSYAHRQVDEQPSKRSKKNDDKSAVAMLKKGDWHESVREPVINYVKGHDRSGRPDEKRDYDDLLDVDHLTHDNWVVYFKT